LLTVDAPDSGQLRAMQGDLLEFANEVNHVCPDAALEAMRRGSDQLRNAARVAAIADLASRDATYDAIKARMSSAANELRAKAALLRLEPVQDALGQATEIAGKVKSLAAEVRSLRKDEIPDKITELSGRVDELVTLLKQIVGG